MYSESKREEIVSKICAKIIKGASLRAALKSEDTIDAITFYDWIDKNEKLAKQYARATELRAEYLFDEIDEIANHTEEDHTPFTGMNVVNRDKLRIDAIKWKLSKMMPKKYGEKLEHDIKSSDGSMSPKYIVEVADSETAKNLEKLKSK